MKNNTNMLRNVRTFFLFGVFIIIGFSVVATVYLARQRTNPRSKAAASTTLSFTPSSQNAGVGTPMTADVNLDPGSNQVSILKLIISYDSTKFDKATAIINPTLINPSGVNAQGFLQILQPFANDCSGGTTCKMSITLSIGSSPTYVITQPLKVASISLSPIAQTDSSGTTVAIDSASAVYSLAPSDQTNENVIQFSSLTPLTVTIGPGNGGGGNSPTPTPPQACISQTTCAWDPLNGAVSYNYVITNVTSGTQVTSGNTTQTSVQFASSLGIAYQCSVTAVGSCNNTGNTANVTNTCSVNPSPTPSPTPSLTPTPTVTPTPVPQLSSCNNACNQNSDCQSGLICTEGSCRNPSCSTQTSCQCPAPTQPQQPPIVVQPTQIVIVVTQPPPQVIIVTQPPAKVVKLPPPTGPGDIILQVGIIGGILTAVGAVIFLGGGL